MNKIYEALRRHEEIKPQPILEQPASARGQFARAIESVHAMVYGIAREVGHGAVLHFVAGSPGEGVSTISSEVAIVAARVADSSVLLLDADRAALTTATKFGCETELGILDQIQAGKPLDDRVATQSDNTGLRIATLSGRRSAPHSRRAMPAVYEHLRSTYDLTIVDCPAVFSDRYLDLCPEAADGVILVVQAERSRPEIIQQARSLIDNAGGKLIGAILNRRHKYIPDFLYRLL